MTVLNLSQHLIVNPQDRVLWDFAGIDGQWVARHLFGDIAVQIAPFQSASVVLPERPSPEVCGSLLRLCEANYRVELPAAIDLSRIVGMLKAKVWIKVSSLTPVKGSAGSARSLEAQPDAKGRMAMLIVPDEWGCTHIPRLATTKPLYSLHPLPLERAAPARIDDKAVLIWRHQWNGKSCFQIQTAEKDKEAIATILGDRLD
ncbi:MAG: hypothetical protein WBA57_11805 [Elainellaceae cyanobacterium]